MNAVTNLSLTPPSLAPLDTPVTTGPSRLPGALQGLSLTILGPTGQIEGPGGEIRVRLESPTVGPEDIPLNEFLQQMDALGKMPVAPLMLSGAVGQLAEATTALAKGIQGQPPMDAAKVAEVATSIEQQATVVERSLRDIIENSTYPNFSDFLKELVRVSQELREMATHAKMAAIEGNYKMMYEASNQMLEAAEKAKESRDKQIEADRKEAIGQIVSGAVSLVVGIGFGAAGAGQLGAVIGQSSSSIISGSFSLSATNLKTESSALQLESDLANVAKQRLEAAAKLIEQQTQIADDLRDIAKGLRDMVLKLYQDFISSQNQVIQRANV